MLRHCALCCVSHPRLLRETRSNSSLFNKPTKTPSILILCIIIRCASCRVSRRSRERTSRLCGTDTQSEIIIPYLYTTSDHSDDVQTHTQNKFAPILTCTLSKHNIYLNMYTFHPNFDIIEFSARSNCYYTHKCTKYCSYDDGMSVRLKRNWVWWQ